MFRIFDDNSIIRSFATACFVIMLIFFVVSVGVEIMGENGIWLAYRAFEFAVYGVFAFGLYRIILLLTQLIGEMKFFRHHYILKDTKTTRVLEKEGRQ